MPRNAREKSETGIYHIMMRGIDKRDIFIQEADYHRFLHHMEKAKQKSGFLLLGYCLMTNHVHLLIKEGNEEIGDAIKRINVGYAQYYNMRYDRAGHLFQNRFRSEPVNDDRYLLTVLRYIHQNPLKAGIVKRGCDYKWSSYGLYLNLNEAIIDKDIILTYFSSIADFIEYNNAINNDACLEYQQRKRYTDDELMKAIEDLLENESLSSASRIVRNGILKRIKEETGASVRQLERVLNIGRNIILKA